MHAHVRSGERQGLAVACFGLAEVIADPVQCSCLVEGSGFSAPDAELAAGVKCLLQDLGRSPVVARICAHDTHVGENVGFAEPLTEIAADAQRVLQGLGSPSIVAGQVACAIEAAGFPDSGSPMAHVNISG